MANTAPNAKTRQVMVGSVALGGGAPCVVQSMLNLPLADVEGNLSQINRLQEAGCEVVRIAVPPVSYTHLISPIGKKMTIVGCGGAGTAIQIQAALDGVSEISIFNRKDDFYLSLIHI